MYRISVCAVIVATLALGCAPALKHTPTTLKSTQAAAPAAIVFQRDVEVTPSSGYTRVLKAGSVWKEVGTIPEGTVYKVEDDVFMLEAGHMHEAHCVISGKTLVGFYLPVEQAFVSVYEKVSLPVKPK